MSKLPKAVLLALSMMLVASSHNLAKAASPEELLNFKSGPLNHVRPLNLSNLAEVLATYHTQYTQGKRTSIPRITVYTSGSSFTGYLMQVDQTGSEKTLMLATVADGERFPHPGMAYIRLDSVQSIVFVEGEESPMVQK